MNTKKVTITLTDDQHQLAKQHSIKLFGSDNVSGLIAYLINNYVPAPAPTFKTTSLDEPQSTIVVKPIETIQTISETSIKPDFEPEVSNILKGKDKSKYHFDGRKCSYTSFKGEPRQLIITDEMIELGKIKGASLRTFSRFPDPKTFNIIKEYLIHIK